MRRTMLLAVLLVLMTSAAARAASTATPPPIMDVRCEEHEVWADGDAAAVAARLPAKYTAAVDPGSGAPMIFARALRCGQRLVADYGIVIDSPDGFGCASGVPLAGPTIGNSPPTCDWYTLSYVTNEQAIAGWLSQGTPAVPVRYVPGLRYDMGKPDARGESTFHFAAPAPSPSAWTIDDVSSLRPGQISLRGAYYFPDTPQGTVKVLVSTDDLTAGPADSTLRAAPGSELAEIMGSTERPSVAPSN